MNQQTGGVAKKILAVMKEVGYVQKDGNNTFQHYKYVSEAAIADKVREAMTKCGLVAIPVVKSFDVASGGNTKSGAPQWLTTMLVDYQIIDPDSGDSVTATVLGQGIDSGDKGPYKAMTGANKYFLMKLLQIPTGDDPEKDDTEPAEERPEPVAPDDQAARKKAIELITGLEENKYQNIKAKQNARQKHLGKTDFVGVSMDALRAYYKHLLPPKEETDERE
jgi:hypothetical protein